MATRDKYEPGTPSWVDLGSPDPAASAAFYGGLFGWTSEEGPPEAGGYRMCMLGDEAVAGIGAAQGDGTWWTTYVTVADADAACKAIEAAGGTVVAPAFDVMDAGRMAVLADPAGAAFSVWQPKEHIGAQRVNEHGTFIWSELTTSDVEAAKRFYADVFGWTYDAMEMPDGTYNVAKVGDNGFGGIMPAADSPVAWSVYFATDDCDATASRCTELGGGVVMPPTDVEGVGRIAVLTGPHGEAFDIIKPVSPAG